MSSTQTRAQGRGMRPTVTLLQEVVSIVKAAQEETATTDVIRTGISVDDAGFVTIHIAPTDVREGSVAERTANLRSVGATAVRDLRSTHPAGELVQFLISDDGRRARVIYSVTAGTPIPSHLEYLTRDASPANEGMTYPTWTPDLPTWSGRPIDTPAGHRWVPAEDVTCECGECLDCDPSPVNRRYHHTWGAL